jgi:hypothetical protein
MITKLGKIFVFTVVNMFTIILLFGDEIVQVNDITMEDKRCGIMVIESKNYGRNNLEIEEIILHNGHTTPVIYKNIDGDAIFYNFFGYYRNAYRNLCYISFTLKLTNDYYFYNDMESQDDIFVGLEFTEEEISYFRQDNNFKNQYEGQDTDLYGEYKIMKQIHFGNNDIIKDIVQYFKSNYRQLIMYMQH